MSKINEEAERHCAQLWEEWWKTPAGKRHLKMAREGEKFLLKLQEDLRGKK